jgi:hypothetical protein
VGFWKNAILLTKRARDQRLARCPRDLRRFPGSVPGRRVEQLYEAPARSPEAKKCGFDTHDRRLFAGFDKLGKIESTVIGRKPPGLPVHYGSFAAQG